MNEKWFDECSVVAYPREIRFLNIDGGSMSYCVDRRVSEYVGKIQAQLNTLQNENRDKDIKNIILQSKIDKLNNENFELAKRIHNTKKIVNKIKKVSDYMNGIACDDLLNTLEGK